jgi:hypothetical protein
VGVGRLGRGDDGLDAQMGSNRDGGLGLATGPPDANTKETRPSLATLYSATGGCKTARGSRCGHGKGGPRLDVRSGTSGGSRENRLNTRAQLRRRRCAVEIAGGSSRGSRVQGSTGRPDGGRGEGERRSAGRGQTAKRPGWDGRLDNVECVTAASTNGAGIRMRG